MGDKTTQNEVKHTAGGYDLSLDDTGHGWLHVVLDAETEQARVIFSGDDANLCRILAASYDTARFLRAAFLFLQNAVVADVFEADRKRLLERASLIQSSRELRAATDTPKE